MANDEDRELEASYWADYYQSDPRVAAAQTHGTGKGVGSGDN